jgi:hypothetical protein
LGEKITELCRTLDRDAQVDALANAKEAEKIAGQMCEGLKQKIAERDEERSWPR